MNRVKFINYTIEIKKVIHPQLLYERVKMLIFTDLSFFKYMQDIVANC